MLHATESAPLHPRILLVVAVTTLAAMLLAAGAVAHASAAAKEPDVAAELARVRQATTHYHDVSRAVADGYARATPCVPGMGFHYQRSVANGQSDLDPLSPELLLYAPRPDGTLQLVAVEYASWEPAELFGRTFDPPGGGPPFHTLHAWVWRGNPHGVFSAHNPTVACR